MKFKNMHPWNLSPQEAIRIQNKLRRKIKLRRYPIKSLNLIAAADVAFEKEEAVGTVTVVKYPELKIIEEVYQTEKIPYPYIPGLLTFREGPVLEKCFRALKNEPQVIIFDGQGIAHPRNMGIATHMGILLEKPTVGCAKTRLCGDYLEPQNHRGAFSYLLDNRRHRIGVALRTRDNVNAIYVSPGHRMDITSAIRIVLLCTRKYRLPEPIRLAHQLTRKLSIIFLVFLLGLFIFKMVFAEEDAFVFKRQQMVEEQLVARGITDKRVLEVMGKIKRELFVPEELRRMAYEDGPLPISYGQTISQPYIVAYMTEAAELKPDDRVLEIGTGSGYQAAILANIVKEVYTIEILEPLAKQAEIRLKDMGYKNIEVKCADGYKGWPKHAPFDAIIVTAAPSEIPEDLMSQLKIGGKMIVPIGTFFQELYLIVRTQTGFDKKPLLPVKFVPMVHTEEDK